MIGRLWLWCNETDPRTWATHAVIALAIALASPVLAVGFYLLREVEQVVYRLAYGDKLHPLDHIMDVLAPALAVGLYVLVV